MGLSKIGNRILRKKKKKRRQRKKTQKTMSN
jgi:hypothetical protein